MGPVDNERKKNMRKEAVVEKVELFRIKNWGKQRNALTRIKALKKGKTVYVPIHTLGRYARKNLYKDPRLAIAAAVNGLESELSDGGSWRSELRDDIKKLKALLKTTKRLGSL